MFSLKKFGFTPFVSAISLVFIVCQQAFVVPYVFYNGGEILLFAFEGWFLYGCVSLGKPNLKLVLFVILSGWLGFFFKSSFIWIYAAGLYCLWIRLCVNLIGALGWIREGIMDRNTCCYIPWLYLYFLYFKRTAFHIRTAFNIVSKRNKTHAA